MNREKLEKRKAALIAALDKLKADLIATDGAIQECDYWLKQIEAEEEKAKTETGE
jgi:hypothetical protein